MSKDTNELTCRLNSTRYVSQRHLSLCRHQGADVGADVKQLRQLPRREERVRHGIRVNQEVKQRQSGASCSRLMVRECVAVKEDEWERSVGFCLRRHVDEVLFCCLPVAAELAHCRRAGGALVRLRPGGLQNARSV